MLNLKGLVAKIRLSQNEKGQGLVEYALILVLVAIVVIAVLLTLGPTVADVYCQVANALQPGSCAGPGVSSSFYGPLNDPLQVPQACNHFGLGGGEAVDEWTYNSTFYYAPAGTASSPPVEGAVQTWNAAACP